MTGVAATKKFTVTQGMSVSGPGCVKTRCFEKLQKLFPLGSRLLFIYPLIVEQPGYIDPVIVSTPHFQKSPLVFTQPGPLRDMHAMPGNGRFSTVSRHYEKRLCSRADDTI